MQKIFKFELPVVGPRSIALPFGAKVLSANVQGNYPFLWVLLDPQVKHEDRTFAVYQTGEEIEEIRGANLEFIGTVFLNSGAYVIHVFEIKQIRRYAK